MDKLFCDLKTDEEKAMFFFSGRGHETGVISQAIQNDVAMAYYRCVEYKKELGALQSQDREDTERLDWIEANHGCDISEFADGRWMCLTDLVESERTCEKPSTMPATLRGRAGDDSRYIRRNRRGTRSRDLEAACSTMNCEKKSVPRWNRRTNEICPEWPD